MCIRDSLEAGSTIEYAREKLTLPATASNGDQTITQINATLVPVAYQNLILSADGVKTAPSAATLTIQGNLTKSPTSTFAANDGLVLLNGTTQSFAGLDFYGLEMSEGTKTTNGNSSVADVLKINSTAVLNISCLLYTSRCV